VSSGLDHRLDRHLDLEVERLAHAGVDDGHVRCGPTMKRPTSSSGFCVATADALDVVGRLLGRRSSVSARCAPRLVCATAWISSTITHSVPAKICAPGS
jgi:hypothetical protein